MSQELEATSRSSINTESRSSEINAIMGAMAKAQGAYKKLNPNQEAPGGDYANLHAILDAVKEALSTNGLGFYQYIQLLDEGSGAALLKTILGHESGQWISSTARVFSGKTDRSTGNTYENHKRMHALMLLGIAPSDYDPVCFDDDGKEQAESQLIEEIKKPRRYKRPDPNAVISKDRHNDLLIELEGYPAILQDILDSYKIETLADLPDEEYFKTRASIMRVKKTQDEYERRQR